MAGLTAARALGDRRCIVLEAEDRLGGRVHSSHLSSTPLNFGAHMIGPPGSLVGNMIADLNLPARPLPKRVFGIVYEGSRHFSVPVSALPLVLRFGLRDRIAVARMGLTLLRGSRRAAAVARRVESTASGPVSDAVLRFEDGRSLSELIGPLPPRVKELLTAITERNGADPAEMSAGHALRSFASVWGKTAPGNNLVGGTSVLPAMMAARLSGEVRTGCTVTHVANKRRKGGAHVTIAYRTDEREGSIAARFCILAAPAPVTAAIAPCLPATAREALSNIRYGAFLTMAAALAPDTPVPWRNNYAILTPGRSFSVLFNHDGMVDKPESGHAVMMFRGAQGGAALLPNTDADIERAFLDDLEILFPETRGRITATRVQRWPLGVPFAEPGRARLQPGLENTPPPFALAGDYMAFPDMEAAARSGLVAAHKALRHLAKEEGA